MTVPVADAVRHVRELERETGSHLYADLVGMQFAATHAEFAAVLHAEAWLNTHRDREVVKKPIELPKPFLLDEEPPATPAEYEYARTVLREHSMFGDR